MSLRFRRFLSLLRTFAHEHRRSLWPTVAGFEMAPEVNGSISSSNKFTVAVEGNIGSGKTTLLDYFGRFSDVEVLQEPVERWRNMKGHNLLKLMYEDPARWSLAFQTYVQLTMVDNHTKKTSVPVKLMERSIHSARHCFVENLYKSGHMSAAEYTVLNEWYEWINLTQDVSVDLIVYLRTSPEVARERIRQRDRAEEHSIPLEYLQALHELHEDWLMGKKNLLPLAPVLVLDANTSLSNMYEVFESHKGEILCHQPLRHGTAAAN